MWCINTSIIKSPPLGTDYPEFCKDQLEDARLHAKSLRLVMEAS